MKVSATGLLSRVAELLPKRVTVENQADMHRFLLREMVRHINMVRNGEATLQEFAEHYCIAPEAPGGSSSKEHVNETANSPEGQKEGIHEGDR